MDYAILKTGNKQYRVSPGDIIDVDTLFADEGSSVELTDVLAVSRDGEVTFGTPHVADASVLAEVRAQAKDKKIIVFKYKRKVRYRRKKGHRQHYTRLAITSIVIGDEVIGIPETPDFVTLVVPEAPEAAADDAPSGGLELEEEEVGEELEESYEESESDEIDAEGEAESDEDRIEAALDAVEQTQESGSETEGETVEATLDTEEDAGQESEQEEQTGGTG